MKQVWSRLILLAVLLVTPAQAQQMTTATAVTVAPRYDESRVLAVIKAVEATYVEAGRPPNLAAMVWVTRVQFDFDGGMSWDRATAKHLAELRVALGLPSIDPPTPTGHPIRGRLRLDRRTFVDDAGPRPALGASFFWFAWGYRHDRARTEANLAWLAGRGVDFVRALGEVGGGSWSDRTIDPAWPDYVDVIRGATQLANTYGIRVEWTLFGGGTSRTEEQWWAATKRAVDAIRPVVAGVQFVEMQNEQQGPPPALVRELAAYVRRELGVEVALTGTPEQDLPTLYGGSAATVGTVHFDRADGDWGWRFARQAWGYWSLDPMPPAFVNNEPAGINGSVRPENDPVKLASDALVTWVSGGAAYVLHHAAGIYGKEMEHPAGGHRFANAWEQPTLESALALIAAIRAKLPADLPNWTRANHLWTAPNPTPPYRADSIGDDALAAGRGGIRMYTARAGDRFVTVVLGIRDRVTLTPIETVDATVVYLPSLQAQPWSGGPITLREADGSVVLVIGQRR